MIRYFTIVFSIFYIFLFTGCSRYFTVGANKGYCEEHGCDYSDAGLCVDPYEFVKNKSYYKQKAYENINCNKCNKIAKMRVVYEK